MRKIKVICRQKNGGYQQELQVNGAAASAEDAETKRAETFLHAFSPETLTAEGTARYGDDFVLVMRTDDTQMQEFDALLQEHSVECE